jgi:diguanylate cyclase (GGDEF)-like protein
LNDQYGHGAGDAELRRVARTLRVAKRRFDVAARIGGEEFALYLGRNRSVVSDAEAATEHARARTP